MKINKSLIIVLFAVLHLSACGPSNETNTKSGAIEQSADADQLTASDIELNNRGVALMGYFDYAKARDVFRQAVDRKPGWHTAKVNLAIATLNRQMEGDEALAVGYLQEVLAADKNNLRAHFILGLLMERAGEAEQAQQHFQFVLDADPQDAYSAYYLAVSSQSDNPERALQLFSQAIEHDPYLRSAYYGAFLLNMRSGNREEGIKLKEVYERLADNPRARLAETKYTRMGPKANALAVGLAQVPAFALPDGPLFGEANELTRFSNTQTRSLTTVDLMNDGQQDLFVAGAKGEHHVVVAAEDEYRLGSSHPLIKAGPATAMAWGDVDNDGTNDAVVCGSKGVTLWLQPASGQWEKISVLNALTSRKNCQDVALFDADHDGDLDVLAVFNKGQHDLLSNNGDVTFRSLAKEKQLPFGQARGRAIVTADLDQDRDADIVVVNEGDVAHDVLWNDRLWNYSTDTSLNEFQQSDIATVTAADMDSDGRSELYAITPSGELVQWAQADEGGWMKNTLVKADGSPTKSTTVDPSSNRFELAAVDFNGDGTLEMLVTDQFGIRVFDVSQRPVKTLFAYEGEVITALPVVTNADRGPSLFALVEQEAEHRLIHFPPGPARGQFASLRFKGKEEKADSMRSNRSGIGTQVAVRRGSQWTMMNTFDHHSGPGQSLQPLAVGLGAFDKIDFVALDWSDGVFQTELDLEAGDTHVLVETQRQLSSCPVIFAWNGNEWQFVSDVLGVGGIGFLHEPGKYGTPRPWEYFQLSSDQLQASDDSLQLMITEPMEELAMIDHVELFAYDLAPGWKMVLDERMATGKPAVTGQEKFYRTEIYPTSVVRDDGLDVTSSVLTTDAIAADLGATHSRFIGSLIRPRSLTLSFDKSINVATAEPLLKATGWVEYPYSQTVFAAWQSGHSYVPPTLEAGDGAGNWTTVYAQFGYPAGMPRIMSLPLSSVPAGTRQLRITSNLEIYWDQFSIVLAEAPGDAVRKSTLVLNEASVDEIGFPLRTNLEQRRPHYNYLERTPFWDTRYPQGNYTQFGVATPLLEQHDGAYAVIGPGEAIALRFSPPATLTAGWTREFVIYTAGYAKDMDMYTQDSGTVGPYPYFKDADTKLHERYNTRYRDGY